MFYNIIFKFFAEHLHFLNVLKYITFRSICAFLTSFVLILIFGNKCIGALKKQQGNGQPIRMDGPKNHIEAKKNTPTMGGLIMIGAIIFSSMLWCDLTNTEIWLCIFVIIGFGSIGAYDDYLKVKQQNSHGISAKKKFLLQSLIALISIYIACHLSDNPQNTTVFFPFMKNWQFNLGAFFSLWAAFVIVGTSNAVNLTDGLDGLAIGPIIISSICLAIICYFTGNIIFAEYLRIPYVPGIAEVCVFLSALVGSGLGFMWFNAPPAKIFMGDTGSIAIGGVIGFIGIIAKHEIIMALIGGIFVIEVVSVILQVIYFKFTKKRIFLMAPIHHHYEKKGWVESTVVFRFWIISIVLGIIGLATLKLR